MWTLRLMSGKEITVSKNEVDAIIMATDSGAKFIRVKSGLVINPSTITEMISDGESLAINPIISDSDWVRANGPDYMARNDALIRLDKKYPLPKFQKEWDEANASKQALVVQDEQN